MVPVRTGSWVLRPLALSVSSNVVSVLPVMSTAAFPCGVTAHVLRARHSNEADLHGPCPESRRGLPAGRGAIRARQCAPPGAGACYCTTLIESPGLGSPLGYR